jgi:hypothetical protein
MNFLIAREHNRDLHAAAERARLERSGDKVPSSVTLRYASEADSPRLSYLAELESTSPPSGDALVAEIDGRIRAALPLDGAGPISDPFHRGAELIELLRVRAAQLGRAT